MNIDSLISTYNTATTDKADEILVMEVMERRRKMPQVPSDVLNLCSERRDFKQRQTEAEIG